MADPPTSKASDAKMSKITSETSALTIASEASLLEAKSSLKFVSILHSSGTISDQAYETYLTLHDNKPISSLSTKPADGEVTLEHEHIQCLPATASNPVPRVFNTLELLDLILEQLDHTGLFQNVRLTCKGFKTAVEASPVLKQRTDFGIFMNHPTFVPLPEKSFFGGVWKTQLRMSKAEAKKKERAIELFLSSKFNLGIKALAWDTSDWDNGGDPPSTNRFNFYFGNTGTFDYPRLKASFERHRTNPTFRNLRLCHAPVNKVNIYWWGNDPDRPNDWGYKEVWHSFTPAPDEHVTFGRLFDEVATAVVEPQQAYVRSFAFSFDDVPVGRW